MFYRIIFSLWNIYGKYASFKLLVFIKWIAVILAYHYTTMYY